MNVDAQNSSCSSTMGLGAASAEDEKLSMTWEGQGRPREKNCVGVVQPIRMRILPHSTGCEVGLQNSLASGLEYESLKAHLDSSIHP